MRLVLVDRAPAVISALREAFAPHPEVMVLCDSILAVAEGAVVSPANSYGYMDGGIDRAYVEAFGLDVEKRVQAAIDRQSNGMLPVGSALLVPSGHPRVPYLIVAPTMELPGPTTPAKVFFAMSALLNLITRHPELTQVCCPGLGTGVGGVLPEDAAKEMVAAYAKWKAREATSSGTTSRN